MTARLLQPDPVAEALAGERAAQRVLRSVKDRFAQPDALLFALLDQLAAAGAAVRIDPRTRAFARTIQKSLEAAAGR